MKLNQEGQHFTLEYEKGVHRIIATYTNGTLEGKLNLPNGKWTKWSAQFINKEENTESEKRKKLRNWRFMVP